MDMMGLFALADQSTVADWPKIEPIAEIVIKINKINFVILNVITVILTTILSRITGRRRH
mgnify:CR=1 FL=1